MPAVIHNEKCNLLWTMLFPPQPTLANEPLIDLEPRPDDMEYHEVTKQEACDALFTVAPMNAPSITSMTGKAYHWCHGMTSLFPFSSLSVPCPISVTFRLHPTSSTCLLPPLLQLQGVLMQLCYICAQTSLGLTLDLLGPDSHAKGYCLYTSYNLSDPFFIINNG